MAVFNPEVPVNQPPSYLQLSKPSEVADVKSVGGIIARGLGDIVSSAATGADTVVKSMIDSALYQSVDTERNKLTGALETATGIPEGERVGEPTQVPSLTASTDVPQGVANGLSRAERMNQAKLQNLDASAYYQSRLINSARELRNTYGEGYRPYIDQRMSEIAGGNPANAYVQKLMQTYIEQRKGQSDDRERINALIRQRVDDTPGMAEIYRKYNAGEIDSNDVMKHIGEAKRPEINTKAYINDKQFKDATRADRTVIANDTFDSILEEEFQGSWNRIMTLTGYSPAEAQNIAERVLAGEKIPGMDDVLLQRIGQSVKAAGENTAIRMRSLANIKNSNGETTLNLLGQEKLNEKIAAKLQPYKMISDQFLDEKAGAAFNTTNTVNAIIRNKSSQLFQSLGPNAIGDYLATQAVLAKTGGAGAEVLMKALSPTMKPPLGTRMDYWLKVGPVPNILTQPDKPDGTPHTGKEYIEKLQQHGANEPDAPAAALSIASLPQTILDKRVPDFQKVNILKGTLSGANVGVLPMIKDDYIDNNGRPVIGQHTIFAQNTNSKIVDEVWRLSQGDKGLWESSKIWMDKERETMVGNDVRQLNVYAANPNIKFTYDTESHKFRAETTGRKQSVIDERGAGFEGMTFNANRILTKINALIPSIVYVAQKEGVNPDAAIMRTFMGMGLDPNVASVGKMLSAMTAATTVADPFGTKSKTKNQDRVK